VYRTDTILRALARLRRRAEGWRAVVLTRHEPGGGAYAQLARDLGLEASVTFLPPLAHERMALLYRAASVCVSVSESESAPTSVVEALAVGTPTIVSDLPWVSEPAYRELRLPVVAVGDDGALAGALEACLGGSAAHDVEHNRRTALARFDRAEIFGAMEGVYEGLAARASISSGRAAAT
jgi:glycosyltransferase involved in cell wall biosynthesis